MADVPYEMMMRDREPDPVFANDEILLRRFRPDAFEGNEVAPEAFELPDMSVNRRKHGPPEWLLLEEEFSGWGVAGFFVEDIPREEPMLHVGTIEYVLRPDHCPLRYNYPHSEVRIYRADVRICRASQNLHLMEPEFHIRWRERLSENSWAVIHPTASEAV